MPAPPGPGILGFAGNPGDRMHKRRFHPILTGLGLWLGIACLPGPSWAGGTPQRIMSLNLCADVLLLHLADRDQIASLTFLAATSPLSPVREQAAGLPVNYGSAEEVVALDPDLVLVHRYSATPLVQALEALGFALWRIDAPASVTEAADQIRALGARIGQPARGQALARQMQALPERRHAAWQPVTAVYGPNGMTAAPGSLLHDLMLRAGLRNFAARHALPGTGRIPLELMLQSPPDALVFSGDTAATGDTLAQRSLQHPALQRLAQTLPTRQIPGEYWSCGGPEIRIAMTRLLQLRTTLVSMEASHAD